MLPSYRGNIILRPEGGKDFPIVLWDAPNKIVKATVPLIPPGYYEACLIDPTTSQNTVTNGEGFHVIAQSSEKVTAARREGKGSL